VAYRYKTEIVFARLTFFWLFPLQILSAVEIDAALPRGLRVFCLPHIVPVTQANPSGRYSKKRADFVTY